MDVKIIKRYPIGNPDRKWRQDNFVISTFSGIAENVEKGLQTLKDAGFNLVEMGWVNIERVDGSIPAAEKVGIDLLIQDWRYFGGFQDSCATPIVDGEIQKFVEKCKQSDRIYGYYVWDEPYMPKDIENAAEQTAIMDKLDPDRLAFSVAIPSYNGSYRYENDLYDDYMSRYITQINPSVFSLDHYPFHFHKPNDETQLDNCPVFKDLFLLRKWSLEKNAPLWFYYQGMTYWEFSSISYEKMSVQAYYALLYGAKAMQHYTALGEVIDEDGNPKYCYEEVTRLNKRFIAWGNTLMALTSTGIFHDDAVFAEDPKKDNYTEDFSNSLLFDGRLPHRISVGEFRDTEGNKYVLILNRDYLEKRAFSLSLKENAHVYEVSTADGSQSLVEENVAVLSREIAPGDCIFLRLQPASETPYLIEYKLEK